MTASRGTLLAGLLLLCLNPETAAAQCPAGFFDAGELSASAGPGPYREVNATKELVLPKGIRIDESYRQKTIRAAGDGAASDLRTVDIQAGIHLVPEGRTGGGWWSISNPKMEKGAEGWRFKIDLYANTGTRTASAPAGRGPGRGDADVYVRICVKTAK